MWDSIFCWQPVTPYLTFYSVPAVKVVQQPETIDIDAVESRECFFLESTKRSNSFRSMKLIEKESFLRKMRIVLQTKNRTNMQLRHQMPLNWDQRYARQFCDLILKDGRAPKKVDFAALSQCVRWIEAFNVRLQEAVERFRKSKDEERKSKIVLEEPPWDVLEFLQESSADSS
uniref:Uncharacterized protein n=1 Tax=Syphacia muris TaxID=451379 RepID=A0A0N5AK60_9BILA